MELKCDGLTLWISVKNISEADVQSIVGAKGVATIQLFKLDERLRKMESTRIQAFASAACGECGTERSGLWSGTGLRVYIYLAHFHCEQRHVMAFFSHADAAEGVQRDFRFGQPRLEYQRV